MPGERIRVRGMVQGVGFRPTVARLARRMGLVGWVRNDAEGVEIALVADPSRVGSFLDRLQTSLPPLAQLERVERQVDGALRPTDGFVIVDSEGGPPRAVVAPDAAVCPACASEVLDPEARRYRYPFATCTHCGPRYSIVEAIPYDRERTTMAGFPMCEACAREYGDEEDRRFHAEPIACAACGPRTRLRRADGLAFRREDLSPLDDVGAAAALLERGEIVAIKGLGGYQLCCDATDAEVVASLRMRKRRPHKPLALMVRDLEVARRYAELSEDEVTLLTSPTGPIVLLEPRQGALPPIAPNVCPDLSCVGLMLPTTPLHHLLLERFDGPIVCTSGNITEEPQCIEDEDAERRLSSIADWFLAHDRPIARRVDDSVVRRMAGETRVVRRARGYAPSWINLPVSGPPVLALGGQLKAAFALSDEDRALLSPYLGDLDDLATYEAWRHTLDGLTELYEHRPAVIAVDLHRGYRSSQRGVSLAEASGLPLVEVQHHHAHVAACMVENGWPADGSPVLGVALDGLGMGLEDELWGGEVMVARYGSFERVGTLQPVELIGGDAASREPWRNLYAHLLSTIGWQELARDHRGTELLAYLESKPRRLLDQLLSTGAHCPRASSCGRLFDAVAAALGLHRDRITFEGQAAMALEALVTSEALEEARAGERYPVVIASSSGLPTAEWAGMWRAILADLGSGAPASRIAARFHVALVDAVVALVVPAAERYEIGTVALSGGCFQNATLLALAQSELRARGFEVLSHAVLPPNDGCIALGQAAIAHAIVAAS